MSTTSSSCDTCEWMDDPAFFGAFVFYMVFSVVTQLIVFTYSGYQMVTIIGERRQWTIVFWVNAIVIVASILRLTLYAVDPHSRLGIYPKPLSTILYWVPIVLWITADFLTALFWVELQMGSGITALNNIKRTRPILIAGTALNIGVTLPLAISTPWSPVLTYVENAWMSTLSIALLILYLFATYRLKRILSELNSSSIVEFLRRLNIVIWVKSFAFLSIGVTIGLYSGLRGWRSKSSLVFEVLLQLEEFVAIMALIFFFQQKQRKGSAPNSGATSSQGTRV
eukprot:TRINITY_DN3826_c0_g1_i1.p1 TRINITY_DN3826_c0_g1~~TRINITY_DN3826_c0_g1_i1.p1  ORF type:complete len:282 (-),score=26.74 TRINITY_DN3826_c0_g1_i1:65-910(-)